MDCFIKRLDIGDTGAWGVMTTSFGDKVGMTLERTYQDADENWLPKIPPDSYVCTRYKSPHFGYEVFLINNVPGHDHCEIHIANWERQLDGCIALGESEQGDMLVNSAKVFKAFMALQDGVDSFVLNIS